MCRLGAAAGIAGPAAFTGAWIAASLRQSGYGAAQVQLSGLAAPDATDPGIMIAGFVVLGGCSAAFGSALRRALGGRRRAGPAPRLIQAAGLLTIAAGLLRRDRMLLGRPAGAAGESWHNHAHDVVSTVIYVLLIAAPLLLAFRFRGDPDWRALSWPLVAGSAVTAVLLGVFESAAVGAWDGTLQRIAVSLPLAMLAAVAVRLIILQAPGDRHRAAPACGGRTGRRPGPTP